MVDDKMCCGIHADKASGDSFLMCRLSDDDYAAALKDDECIPMEMGTKSLKGYLFVKPEGYAGKKKLSHLLQLCLNFNPQAKSSKKKKKS